MQFRTLFLTLSVSLFAGSLLAQTPARAPFQTGYIYDFETSVDDGGDVSSHFFHVRGGVPFYREEGRFIGLSGAYYLNAYTFSGGGAGSFAALDPWDKVHTFRVGLPVRWKLNANWDFFLNPSIRFVGESGADVSDAISGGGITGLTYRFGDNLLLGPGVGYITQIEDDASIFPVIFVDWKFAENFNLSTGPAVGATLGPGLSINWQMTDQLIFSIGARYEKLRFRLDENARAAAGGVGEDRGVPVFGAISYEANDNWRFSVLGGVSFGNRLTLDDSGGERVADSDYGSAPFVGVNAGFSF